MRQKLIQFQPLLAARQTTIAILRFEPPADCGDLDRARFDAARVSMNQKIKSFQFLGAQIEPIAALPFDLAPPQFRALLDRLNADPQIRGIIVQYPIPRQNAPFVRDIAPDKDLDALGAGSAFQVPATSEGIVRVVTPYATDAIIAVVGARGFVGQGVIRQLREQGLPVMALDRQDAGFAPEDLLRIQEADIVVSATGQPDLLDERHLRPVHRLIVDAGFVRLGDQVYGDVRESARVIAQNFTPVPGGIGPIEMAVLMERLVENELGPDFQAWQLETTGPINYLSRSHLQQRQQAWAAEIYPVAMDLFVQAGLTEPAAIIHEPDARILEGRNYRLRLDSNEAVFAIEGTRGRGILASYRISDQALLTASGLTAIDLQNWRGIERQMINQRQQLRQDQEPEL